MVDSCAELTRFEEMHAVHISQVYPPTDNNDFQSNGNGPSFQGSSIPGYGELRGLCQF